MKNSHFSTLGKLTGHGGEACVLQGLCLLWLGGRSSPKRRLMHVESVEAIRGPVPGEACVFEDLCQRNVTPGRSTKAGLVEGDRPDWGQFLVRPVCLKPYASGVLPLAGPPKLDWSRVTDHTGDSPQ